MKCRHCNQEMIEGKAFAPTVIAGLPDFPSQTDLRGQTLSDGPGKLVIVDKCPACGHSVTSSNATGEQSK